MTEWVLILTAAILTISFRLSSLIIARKFLDSNSVIYKLSDVVVSFIFGAIIFDTAFGKNYSELSSALNSSLGMLKVGVMFSTFFLTFYFNSEIKSFWVSILLFSTILLYFK